MRPWHCLNVVHADDAVDEPWNASDYALLSPQAFTAVEDAPPARTALLPNHPNPFNPYTSIRFELAADGPVRLTVFDLQGRAVRRVLDEIRTRGHRSPLRSK